MLFSKHHQSGLLIDSIIGQSWIVVLLFHLTVALFKTAQIHKYKYTTLGSIIVHLTQSIVRLHCPREAAVDHQWILIALERGASRTHRARRESWSDVWNDNVDLLDAAFSPGKYNMGNNIIVWALKTRKMSFLVSKHKIDGNMWLNCVDLYYQGKMCDELMMWCLAETRKESDSIVLLSSHQSHLRTMSLGEAL